MSTKNLVKQDLRNIYLGNIYTVEANLTLPESGHNGSKFTWTSEYEYLIDTNGFVNRPRHGTGNRVVQLVVTATLDDVVDTRTFDVTVLEQEATFSIERALPAYYRITRDELQDIPPFAVVMDNNEKLSMHAVRWKLPFEDIEDLPKEFTITGVSKYQKGGNLLETTDDMEFVAHITVIDHEEHEPASVHTDVRSLPMDAVHVSEGRLHTNQDLMEQYLLSVNVDDMLYSFRTSSGLDTLDGNPMTGWDGPECKLRGHTTGHYLSALALATAATSDDTRRQELQRRLEYLVAELAKVQDAFLARGHSNYGFFSAYSEEQFDLLEEYVTYPNIWAPYYTLHKLIAGLLDAYEIAKVDLALEICKKKMVWLDRRFGRLSAQTIQNMWAMYIAGEYGGMNDVVARYVDLSGETKYVELAKVFDNPKLFYPLERNIDAINTMHANQHIPQVVGALKLYEVSGEEVYYDVAKNFWDMATQNHIYNIGGIGEGEMFRPSCTTSQYLTEKTAEGCASYNMLKLTKMLFAHEPKVSYADYYERTMLNHIAASLEPHQPTGGSTYFMPLANGSVLGYDSTENTCCHGTGLENHVRYQEAIYYLEETNSERSLYINLFNRNELDWADEGIKLRQTADFISEQRVHYVFDKAAKLALKIRIPSWLAAQTDVIVNGETVAVGQPGSYVSVARDWVAGDTVDIALPFSLRYEASLDRDDLVSILYGPLVLTILDDRFDTIEIPALETLAADFEANGDGSYKWNEYTLRPHYLTDGSPYHSYFRTEV